MDESDDEYVDHRADSTSAVQPRRRVARRAAADDAAGAYSWEDEYHRSWDVVQEDAGGSLGGVVAEMQESAKKRRLEHVSKPVRRGIIRNLVLILDLTFAMLDTDMRPSRQQVMINYAIDFVNDFFNQNPISQMAVVTMKDGLAHLLSPLDGNPHAHIQKIQTLRKAEPEGVPSLENALEMAKAILLHVPTHNTREVLLIFGSLISNDPGDINKTIDSLVEKRVRVRIIGLAAQVAVCSKIAKTTNFGDSSTYSVVLNEQHFKQLFHEVTTPMAVNSLSARNTSVLVQMGFPPRISEQEPSLCACHSRLTKRGYQCPRCMSKVCTLPMLCPVCNLTLILSTHLARPYHHIFPLQAYKEVSTRDPATAGITTCFSCFIEFNNDGGHKFQCPKCSNLFCIDCDVFAHETLHNCPGCEAAV